MQWKVLLKTSTNVVLEVQNEKGEYSTNAYDIYLNGEKQFTTDKMIESIYGLEPDTEYEICLKRDEQDMAKQTVRTEAEYVTLDVRVFGAKGDGETDDTAAIQAAILTCPPQGRVLITDGCYRFTHLFLKDHLRMELTKSAELRAICDKAKLPVLPGRIESCDKKSEYIPSVWEGEPVTSYASLLTGMYVEDVIIYGGGVIDGNGSFEKWWNKEFIQDGPARPRILFLNHCKNVTVQGVTFRNSPAWNAHPLFSENVKFIDLEIQAPDNSRNTDGINPESCTGVEIAGIHFSVGDDCIAIKSGKMYMGKTYKTPSKDVLIRNCLMERGHGGVTIGSEVAAGVDNILVKNCCFMSTDRGLRVKTRRGRGKDSYVSGVTFEDVRMEGVRIPFVINCFYYCDPDGKTEYVRSKEPLPVDDRTPRVGTIKIKNVECRDCHVVGLFFYGLPESKIEKVIMENVVITYAKDAKPGRAAMMENCETSCRKGVFVRNAKAVKLKNVRIEGNEGEAVDLDEVDDWSWVAGI